MKTKQQEQGFFHDNQTCTLQTKKTKKRYIADYHREYRKVGLNQDYYEALSLLNLVVRQGKTSPSNLHQLSNIVCCDYEFLINHLGLSNEYVMNAFRLSDMEVDHLIPKKWFSKHPEYVHYMNHWSNLVVSTKEANRKKAGSIDYNNPAVVMMLTRMRLEMFYTMVTSNFETPQERAKALQLISKPI